MKFVGGTVARRFGGRWGSCRYAPHSCETAKSACVVHDQSARTERSWGGGDAGRARRRLLCAGHVVRASHEPLTLTRLLPTTRVPWLPLFQDEETPSES